MVELTVRRRDGVTGFRFSAAVNWDSAFTAFQTVLNSGYRSRTAPERGSVGSQFRDEVLFVFSPSDYNPTVPAVKDDVPFYVRVEPRLADGTFGPAEGMQIILPYVTDPNPPVILRGTASPAAGLTGSTEINLPGLCSDFYIRNQSTGSNLFVAFDRGVASGPVGPEYLVGPGTVLDVDYANASRVYFRGGTGGSAEVHAVFTKKSQPFNL